MPSEESTETIAIASDHAGLELKSELKKDLIDLGFSVLDLGADSLESVDYPPTAIWKSAPPWFMTPSAPGCPGFTTTPTSFASAAAWSAPTSPGIA